MDRGMTGPYNIHNKKRINNLKVQQDAPVIAEAEIEINAPRESVWEIMTDIENWPSWNQDVSKAELKGELQPGTEFHWKAGPGTIKSQLQVVQPPDEIAWTGKTMGIKAVHVWQLEDRDGKTLIRTEESWDGLIVKLFKKSMQRTLQGSIDAGLEYLKAEAEKRVAT